MSGYQSDYNLTAGSFDQITLAGATPNLPVVTDDNNNLVTALIDLTSQTTGTLPIVQGGTNSTTALANGSLMVSAGGQIVEGTSASTPTFTGATLTGLTASQPVKTNGAKALVSGLISLTADVTGTLPVTSGGTNSATVLANGSLMVSAGGQIVEGTSSSAPTFTGATLTGLTASQPVKTTAGKALTSGLISLSADVTGTLPVASGGTNSTTALANGALMVSAGGKVVEGTSSSAPTFTSATLSGLAIDAPVRTSAGSSTLTTGPIDLNIEATGTLPVANGGTGSGTALTNGKLMFSNAGEIVEGPSATAPTFAAVTVSTLTASQPVKTNGANALVSGLISLTADVTGVLPVANGGSTGGNTGDVTLAAVGAVPNANGATLTAQVLNLQPANGTNPGVVTTGAQTFAGTKTLSGQVAFTNATASTSPTTGAVVITGGLGVGFGQLWSADIINANRAIKHLSYLTGHYAGAATQAVAQSASVPLIFDTLDKAGGDISLGASTSPVVGWDGIYYYSASCGLSAAPTADTQLFAVLSTGQTMFVTQGSTLGVWLSTGGLVWLPAGGSLSFQVFTSQVGGVTISTQRRNFAIGLLTRT